jgi:hypothetical protein
MENPSFHDAKQMQVEAMRLPKAEKVEVFDPEGRSLVSRALIRNAESKEMYEVVSDDYEVTQDAEVIFPLIEAIEDLGITPHGGFRDAAHGHLRGYIFFDEEITRTVLDGNDNFNFGISVHNSHTGKTSFGVTGMTWRLICTNGMYSKNILGGFAYDHLKRSQEDKKYLKYAIESIFKNIPRFLEAVERTREVELNYADATELLTGLGMAERSVEDLIVNMPRYTPGFDTKTKVSVWALSNAITFRASENTISSQVFERDTEKAERLLVVKDYEPIIERGRELIRIRNERKKKGQ